MSRKHKKPRVRENPLHAGKGNVRVGADPGTAQKKTPAWKIGTFDVDGPWGHSRVDTKRLWTELFPKLKNYESMTWAEIERDKHHNHSVPVDQLISEARRRLEQLKLDDVESLFRFRFSGKERLWGRRDLEVFYLIWWDPEHEICPSPLRNT
jgi:hypothetical protein